MKISSQFNYSAENRIDNIRDTLKNKLIRFVSRKLNVELIYDIKDLLDSTLKEYHERKWVKGDDVSIVVEDLTWKGLYPKYWVRWKAKMAKFLSSKFNLFELNSSCFSFWHIIFPFEIKISDPFIKDLKKKWFIHSKKKLNGEDWYQQITSFEESDQFWDIKKVDADFIEDYIHNYEGEIKYEAKLIVPYKRINILVNITPIESIESTDLSFHIDFKEV